MPGKKAKKELFNEKRLKLLTELELHVQKVTGYQEVITISTMAENWKKLSSYFVANDVMLEYSEDDYPGLALENIQNKFGKDCPKILHFLEGVSADGVDAQLKQQLSSNAPQIIVYEIDIDSADDGSYQFFIAINKQLFVELNASRGGIDYTKALLVLLSCFYTFNLQYDQSQKYLYQFLEENVLGIKPIKKVLQYRKFCNSIFK